MGCSLSVARAGWAGWPAALLKTPGGRPPGAPRLTPAHPHTHCAQEDEPAVAELLEAGQKALLVVGGRGGRGNHSFKTRMNTAPTLAERGEAGYEEWLDLELKV